jgi:hypothetical protein
MRLHAAVDPDKELNVHGSVNSRSFTCPFSLLTASTFRQDFLESQSFQISSNIFGLEHFQCYAVFQGFAHEADAVGSFEEPPEAVPAGNTFRMVGHGNQNELHNS